MNKLQKLKVLVERGATEGEREAAKAGIKRLEKNHPGKKDEFVGWKFNPSIIYKRPGDYSGTSTTTTSSRVYIYQGFGLGFTD